jgi:TonB family protein
MSAYALSPELGQLSEDSDRRFRRLLLALALPALIAGVAIPFFQISSILKGGGVPQSPRYAKLLTQTPAPAVEDVSMEQKTVTQPRPQLTQEQKVEKARKKAAKAIASLQDTLSELRDTELPTVNKPLLSSVVASPTGKPSFESAAAKASGGIGEVGAVERKESQTQLQQRRTTAVRAPSGTTARPDDRPGQGGDKLLPGRTSEEIQLVLDRGQSALYAMYLRLLREKPQLRGVVTVRITIAPSGQVTACKIVSSALREPEFEKKIVARLMLLNFGAKDVPEMTLDFPIHFFPQN